MSRQPQLPNGLPPRPSASFWDRDRDRDRNERNYNHSTPERNRRDMGDSYHPRPSQYDSYVPHTANRDREIFQFNGHNPPPTAYGSYAPGVQPPRRPAGAGDTYRMNDGYRPPPPPSFDFRYDAPQSIDFEHTDRFQSRAQGRNNHSSSNRDRNEDHLRRRREKDRRDINRGRGGYRGRGGPRLASDRLFLKGKRSPTPELMPGMNEDAATDVKYRDVGDLSDSDEAEMEMSDDDDNNDQPKKKMARTSVKTADADSVPKWSNPDPYTALPPPGESDRKKKDVVKLIRKARVTSGQEGPTKIDAAQDDFISFDFGAPETIDSEEDEYEPRAFDQSEPGSARSFSHLENIRKFDMPQQPQSYASETREVATQLTTVNSMPGDVIQTPKRASKPLDLSTDPALGSRKRTVSDVIKPPPLVNKLIPGKPPRSSGVLLPEWRVKPGMDDAPWLQDHSDTSNMGFWLHKEIMDFYHYVKPRKFEEVIRQRLLVNLRENFRKYYRDADILAFGSFPAGLYLPTADMDVVMVSNQYMDGGYPKYNSKSHIWRVKGNVEKDRLNTGRIEVIVGAKVPLAKWVDGFTGLKVDMSFENDTGLIANKTFQEWKAQFPAMPILVTIIKHLLAMRGLNEPVNGGIGGFSVTCLVVSLLQNMPQVKSKTMIPEHHLGEVLMEFLDLYGNEFNTRTTAISTNPPKLFSKSSARDLYRDFDKPKFSIIDPNNSDNDIAGGSKNTPAIQDCFSAAFSALLQSMNTLQNADLETRRNQSLLRCIIGGNYESFKLQRDHLAHLHEQLIGPIEDE
ncbi:hypothetical protein SS1G_04619 [Sclerotinia sclerotiorum 1980 UF-70]|uniref:polynucleotide adenylyltransferase n=2 Tax=Sclerotinia sclerotiorum (strain ATCC 18683 / 1980 / Ss-1) TaxID=665079 RepID=A7EH27_SCLS1|nr:hypothetical protein SS1G_04619 [Sclerotinia sclerotiorum 1980 UF-70]APA06768.1 hypothetical protein sscle_02g015380 [Sclerotinia sclerotiorum 1980 UF-70]EDO02143.1 hypothetical protein SS1G_04619 [Sclerotinia sclerotiorum 1980 UF-70]